MLKHSIKVVYRKYQFNIQFIVLCVLAGVGSALFSMATDRGVRLSLLIFKDIGYWVLIVTPTIFVLTAYLLRKYFPYAGGSGLPQGYAIDVFENEVLKKTYSIRTMIGKVVLTFMGIIAGASLGREGPTIQICASIFSSLKNITLEQKKFLIRVGSGVGVATAFNAPLGGIMFALEEYIHKRSGKITTFLLLGIAIAGYITVMITGDYTYMGKVDTSSLYYSYSVIPLAIFAGVLCGLGGALFTWVMVFVSVGRNSKFCKWRKANPLKTALTFGVLVAALGLLTSGLSFGNGSIQSSDFLNSNISAPWFYGIAKATGAIFSVAAGVPGGYFSTALSIGLGFMSNIHDLLPVLPLQQYYLLGMVGFLSAITAAPITAVIMVVSIVSDTQHFVIPLILTSTISSVIASYFGDSVYHQQVLMYIDKSKYHLTKGE